jgi:hypothetical protein
MESRNEFCTYDSTSNRHNSVSGTFSWNTGNLTSDVHGVGENDVQEVSFFEWNDRVEVDGICVVLAIHNTGWRNCEGVEKVLRVHDKVDVLTSYINFKKVGVQCLDLESLTWHETPWISNI